MISDEERHLWRQAMRDVAPLRAVELVAEMQSQPIVPPPNGQVATPTAKIRALPPLTKPRTVRPNEFADLDRASAQRLRLGQMPIENRLDLHGMNESQAHDTLLGFITAGHRAGLRCVLVITGKGRNKQEGAAGILRQSVPRWLNEAPVQGKILAISQAQPKHGGDGALYVLIKRKREERR